MNVKVKFNCRTGPRIRGDAGRPTRSLATGGTEVAGVDIGRVEDGLIVEGWELLEPVAEAASHFLWWKKEPPLDANQL